MKQLRYLRERRTAAVRAGLEDEVLECSKQISVLEQAAQARRPWASRVQAAADAERKAAERLKSVTTDLEAARTAVAHFEEEKCKADAALAAAKAALAAVQAEVPKRMEPAVPAMTLDGVDVALRTLAESGAELKQGGGDGGAGDNGGAILQVVHQLQSIVSELRRGGAAAVHADGVAEARAGLAASRQPGDIVSAERLREDDLPTQPMVAAAAECWQEVLRRVPHGRAAQGPQADLRQMFACQKAGTRDSKGESLEVPLHRPY